MARLERAGVSRRVLASALLAALLSAAFLAAPAGGPAPVTPVPFRFRPAARAHQVALAGSFNNWDVAAQPMADPDSDGVWETRLTLSPGTYAYKFVVDGSQWFQDPDNPARAPDGFGGFNSVLTVEYDARVKAPARRGDGEINRFALFHDPDGLDQVVWATAENPALRFLFLRLATRAGDVAACGARIYRVGESDMEGFRDYDMEPYALTDPLEYRAVTLPLEDDPSLGPRYSRWRGYRLWLDDEGDVLWLGADSLSRKEDRVARFDPLLRRQVAGATAPGTVDPSQAGVSDRVIIVPSWVQDAVFYQVFPERFRNGDRSNDPDSTLPWGSAPPSPTNFFGGDLKGVLDALPYLDSLGVNALYLNPIFQAPSNHKYDATDYKKIDPHFGDEGLFKELLDAAHARGMKIILDGVFNHVSDQNPYFTHVVDYGKESEVWQWFRVHGDRVVKTPKPNYDCWGGYANLPEWNNPNPEVRDYLLSVVRYWTEMGIDGWRLDVPNEVPHDFWVLFRETVKAFNSRAYLVGEIWNRGTPWLLGNEFDAVMNYRFRDACLGFFADTTLDAAVFDRRLAEIRIDTPDPLNRISFNLLDSHDTARILTACGGDEARMRLAVLFQMTYCGAPVVYYGDEVGMRGEKDPGCRGTFPWRVAEQNGPLREYYRTLIRLRHDHPGLRRGTFLPVLAQGGQYLFLRRSADEVLLVVINRTERPASFHLTAPKGIGAVRQKDAVDLLTGVRHPIRSGEIFVKDIPPMTGAVLQLK